MARLYAAGGGVSVVANGGVETGLDGRGARCLAVDPTDPKTLYVGTTDEGLFKAGTVGEAGTGCPASSTPGLPRSPSRRLTGPSTRARSLRPCSSAATGATPGGSWRR